MKSTYCSPPPCQNTTQPINIKVTVPSVTRDQYDTLKKLLTLSYIDEFYPQDTWMDQQKMPHSSHPCPAQSKQISLPQIILTQSRHQNTSITTMPPLQHPHTRHTSSLQLHPHTHHIVTPGFVDRPRRSDCTAGQMDGEAGWRTTSGNIRLPSLARVMGVGRQQDAIQDGGAGSILYLPNSHGYW